MAEKLTVKQLTFCNEYLIDLNATQAAIRSGYAPKNANNTASALMANPKISAHISKKIAERSRRTGVNADRVIRELARVAFVKPTDVINSAEATVREDSSDDDIAAIASIRVKKIPTSEGMGIEREVKLHDKIKALEMLGKHLNIFGDPAKEAAQAETLDKLDEMLKGLSAEAKKDNPDDTLK
ncbi:MAG: terminase small subunit [Eubacteriales bacterium]